MGLQTAFDVLSHIVEHHESRGKAVRQVEVTTSDASEDVLHVTMDVPVSFCAPSSGGLHPDLSPEAATLTDDGGLQVEFSTSDLATLPSTTEANISASKQAVRVTDDVGLVVTVELTIDPTDSETRTTGGEDGQTAGVSAGPRESTTDESSDGTDRSATAGHHDDADSDPASHLVAARNEELPAYEDTEYLQRLYDSCDTFTEMSRKIEMDVASETVRRYMIEAGIHDPTSYNTATEENPTVESAEAETAESVSTQSPSTSDDPMETISDEQLVADGIGLPEDIQIEDVADAVVDSMTVFEVQRHLGLEQQRARDLLEQLNLLELVMRRIAGNPEREVTYEEVATRIRQCTPSGA